MKRKSRLSRKASGSTRNLKVPNSVEIPASEYLSSMESIASIENAIVDDANRDELEATERDYAGRSTQEEDGAIPVIPPEQNPISEELVRRPGGPPKHNM